MPRTLEELQKLKLEIRHKLLLLPVTSYELLCKLLKQDDIDVHFCDPKTKKNALFSALMPSGGEPDRRPRIRLLLEAGVDINKQMEGDNFNNTPLHNAIANECFEIAIYTMEICNEMNIDLNYNAKDILGTTLLSMAAKFNQPQVAKKILELGKYKIKVNEQDKAGNTALHYAVLLGQFELVGDLLQADASIAICNKNGKTPLDMLNATNDDVCEHLQSVRINFERDENAKSNSFSHDSGRGIAAVLNTSYPRTQDEWKKSEDAKKHILKLAKQLNIRTLQNSRNIYLFIDAKQKNINKLMNLTAFPILDPSSETVNRIDWSTPYSPVYTIMKQEDIKKLANLGNDFTGTSLFTRIFKNRKKTKSIINSNNTQKILEKKMIHAAMHNTPNELRVLTLYVKNIDAKYKGETALHWAFKNSSPRCVSILFNAQANPEIEDDRGVKPIDYLKPIDIQAALAMLCNKSGKMNNFFNKQPAVSKSTADNLQKSDTDYNHQFCVSVKKIVEGVSFKPSQVESKYLDMLRDALKSDVPYNNLHAVIKKIDTVNHQAFFSTFKGHMQPVRNKIVKLMREYNKHRNISGEGLQNGVKS